MLYLWLYAIFLIKRKKKKKKARKKTSKNLDYHYLSYYNRFLKHS